jgi:hypothetical protein
MGLFCTLKNSKMARIILTGNTDVKVRESIEEVFNLLNSSTQGNFIYLNTFQIESTDVTDKKVIVNIDKIKVIYQ